MGLTRRQFLFSGVSAAAVLPSDFRRYPDPATEFEVLRLTDPAHASFMPAYYGHALARHNSFLLFWSDRTGSPQAFRMDLRSGECRQLTEAQELDGSSVTLLPDERSFCYFDGSALRHENLANLKGREIYRVPEGWQRTAGSSVSPDGLRGVFAESREGTCRLRLLGLARGAVQTVVEAPWNMTHPMPNPRRAQILYRQGNEALWVVSFDGRQNRKLKLAEGTIGPARWSPDGRTVLYLHLPADSTQLHAIREVAPDQNQDKMVAKTSQFAHFGVNANGSVFVGSSQNKASPTILLLLRITRRELTLCEHKASDPSAVAPVFSPDSQRVYFQSDRHGKPAIYMMRVDKFVEKTEGEAG